MNCEKCGAKLDLMTNKATGRITGRCSRMAQHSVVLYQPEFKRDRDYSMSIIAGKPVNTHCPVCKSEVCLVQTKAGRLVYACKEAFTHYFVICEDVPKKGM